MTYTLGVDLGTTTSAAAILSDRTLESYPLGESSLTVPSIVLPRDDGRTLIGEAAALHGGVAPVRLARLPTGDPAFAGWDPHEAMCMLLDAVIEEVASERGGRPDRLALVQPAVDVTNATSATDAGGPYGRVAAETPGGPMLVAAPIAAATLVDHERGLGPGSTVGVLDLGGDVSEAALVRRTGAGFDLVGRPCTGPGIGGVEIDTIVLRQIDAALDNAVSSLDPDADLGALDRLLAGCRRAKEQLLRAEEAVVEVGLPRMTVRVRLTRSDLQRLVRPHLVRAVAALERTIAETGLSSDDLEAVVLVGGSARLPVASDLVAERIGRPVVVGAAPEMTAALGAALAGTPAADRPEPVLVPPLPLGAPTPAGGIAMTPAALAGEAADAPGAAKGRGGGRRRRFVEQSVACRRPGDGQPAHRAPAPRNRGRWSGHLRRTAVAGGRDPGIDDLDDLDALDALDDLDDLGEAPPASVGGRRSGADGDRTGRRVLIASATVLVLMAVGGTLLATGAADRGADGQPVDSIETSENPADGGLTGFSDPARPTSIGSASTSDPSAGDTTTSSSTAPDQDRASGSGHGSLDAADTDREGGDEGNMDGAGSGDGHDTDGGDPANDHPSDHRGDGTRRGDGRDGRDGRDAPEPPTGPTNPPTTSPPAPVPAPPPPGQGDLVDQLFDVLFSGS